jgi:hypothetical protein
MSLTACPPVQLAKDSLKDSYLGQQIGKVCTVQFRRDALGAAAALPVSPTTDGINGAEVTVTGTLRAVENDGIALEPLAPRDPTWTAFWIPKDSILLIEVHK